MKWKYIHMSTRYFHAVGFIFRRAQRLQICDLEWFKYIFHGELSILSRPLKATPHVLPSNILFINNRINDDLTDFLQLAQGGITNELFVKKIYIYFAQPLVEEERWIMFTTCLEVWHFVGGCVAGDHFRNMCRNDSGCKHGLGCGWVAVFLAMEKSGVAQWHFNSMALGMWNIWSNSKKKNRT